MTTLKFGEAKTDVLNRAIHLLDMFRFKDSLTRIKAQAKIEGLELKGRTFKAIYPQLVEFYENALMVEEAETLVIM